MIRPFHHLDTPYLWAIHRAQGHPYPFPAIDSPQFCNVQVFADENDVPVHAMAARRTVELYLIGDPAWRTPHWRITAFADLFSAMKKALAHLGYSDMHAELPPSVEKAFGRRMQRDFGWIKSHWQSLCCYLQ